MEYNLVGLEDIPLSTVDPLSQLSLVDIYKIFNRMEKVCLDNDGIGLSATQVGLPWNMFLINKNGFFEYYLNCTYESKGELVTSIEGCLSLKDQLGSLRRFELNRYSSILVEGKRLTVQGSIDTEEFSSIESGLYAIVFQHEIDHSFGVFIKDKGKEIYIS